MIKKLLGRLGYIHKDCVDGYRDLKQNPLTEEELSFMLVELMKDTDMDIDEKAEEMMFKEARHVVGLAEWLTTTAMRDMRRHFGTIVQREQDIIRGAFARTMHIKSKLSGTSNDKTKLEGKQYK